MDGERPGDLDTENTEGDYNLGSAWPAEQCAGFPAISPRAGFTLPASTDHGFQFSVIPKPDRLIERSTDNHGLS